MIKNALAITLILFAIISPFILIPQIVQIKRIECTSQYGVCLPNTQKSIDSINLSNLYKTKNDSENLLSEISTIKDFSVNFKLPDKLSISVIESKPIYAVKSQGSDLVALVDEQGAVTSFVDSTPLTTLITGNQTPNLGEKIDESDLFALTIISNISEKITSAKIEDNKLRVKLESDPDVIFPLNGDKDVLLGSMTLILSRLKDDGENLRIEEAGSIREIDLQFKNPVIRL